MTDLHWLSAAELADAYARREVSPVELVRALLARIADIDPKTHAFIYLDAEAALQAAQTAEWEMSSGRSRGPLHGIPIGIKDIIDVAGLPTTCHSKILAANLAGHDAAAIRRFREAGAIILGKLSTFEFAIGGPSFDLPFPPARNPWNLDHHTGGSSSGSGAGLAAGLFPLALGSDTGGSIRNPASACGVVGLKPTYGLVSRRGVFPLSQTLDHVGPMSRTVADTALLMDAIAGLDPADPGGTAPPGRSFAADLDRGLRGLRIGFVTNFHETDMPADPEVRAALEEVVRVLQADGATVRRVVLPPLSEFAAANRTIMLAEAWSIHREWLRSRPQDYGASARQRLLPGGFLSADDYVQALRHRTRLIDAVQDTFRDVDILLTASSMDPPCRIDDPEAIARTYPRQSRLPFNLTGHPALAMMAGISKAGLPLAAQFVGRHFEDATVLRVAAAYERATHWDRRRPPIA